MQKNFAIEPMLKPRYDDSYDYFIWLDNHSGLKTNNFTKNQYDAVINELPKHISGYKTRTTYLPTEIEIVSTFNIIFDKEEDANHFLVWASSTEFYYED